MTSLNARSPQAPDDPPGCPPVPEALDDVLVSAFADVFGELAGVPPLHFPPKATITLPRTVKPPRSSSP